MEMDREVRIVKAVLRGNKLLLVLTETQKPFTKSTMYIETNQAIQPGDQTV